MRKGNTGANKKARYNSSTERFENILTDLNTCDCGASLYVVREPDGGDDYNTIGYCNACGNTYSN